MIGRAQIRTLVILGGCLALLVHNWPFIEAPLHRLMALTVLATVLSFAAFYELSMRDASTGWVLVAVLGVIGAAAVIWLLFTLFYRPLPNDHAPLVAAGEPFAACSTQVGALEVELGKGAVIGRTSSIQPFQVGSCPGPTLRRTPHGLLVNTFGYDDDGTVIFQVRDNQFTVLLGDYLHLHRPDRSSLGIYDKWEREVFYLRYVNQNTIRIRGRFLCGDAPLVTIDDGEIRIGEHRRISGDFCIASSRAINFSPVRPE
jgi:hypothetical protein